MDSDFQNFYLLEYIKDFSMYIFVCVVFGFGSMIYYFSIKAPNPAFDSPKLLKKKTKKEKQIRSKVSKISSENNESKAPVNYVSEIINEPIVTMEIVDDDNDSSWLPATKPRKNLKPLKQIVKSEVEIKKEIEKKLPHAALSKPIERVKPFEKPSLIKPPCDIVILESQKSQEKPEITKEVVPVPLKVTEDVLTESPTNSCSDDFEIVDIGKTSSEDASGAAPVSSTSGASRKKNKKQQKLISKQLMDAASLETDQDRQKSIPEPAKSKPTVTNKKKRPRKED